ncbi:hypothetical protein SUGI_0096370 [Cryptomeria japonica]|uniref:uncharacterized protein LOC131059174 n=1 Tax=Cryptomeria japonica TaxID=3369 RepID=UPI002408C430|nr:uncharacterized protein LOC131059174 [Cryptomeria japonica]GLJ08807.1 hypothetical protein SUGI_0096370 [Cryptomeria japonica]
MSDLKEVIQRMLLPLQLSLGIFQIMKTTPLWAIVHCTLAYLLHCFHFPYTDYKQLEGFKGRVFKKVISHATAAGDVSRMKKQKGRKKSKKEGKYENVRSVIVDYMGKKFELEQKEGNKMVIKDGFVYYITDKMWETVLHIKEVAPQTVFVKDHKEIWDEVVTGDIMELEQVLDSVILDNRAVVRLDHDYFLPVNLLKSEDRVLKTLNLVALSLRSQNHIHWLIPVLLTLTAAVMGFSTTLSLYVGRLINKLFCGAIQFLCERLPLRWRRRVYFLGNWVENLKPSNDLELKVMKQSMCPLIAGGAKAHFQSSPLPCNMRPQVPTREARAKKYMLVSQPCGSLADCSVQEVGPFFFSCGESVYIEWTFNNHSNKCSLKAGVLERGHEKSLKPHDISVYIVGDNEVLIEEDIKILTCDRGATDKLEEGVEYSISVFGDVYYGAKGIPDGIDTVSVDVDCSSKKAIKLFKLALYMADQKSGSLKSYEPNAKTVSVRRFIESINAYVRSGYPPLYKLDKLENVFVR